MLHHGQRLAFRLEPRDHLDRIHSGLDNFEGYLPANRTKLLREPNVAHAALTELLLEPIRTDAPASTHSIKRGVRRVGSRSQSGILF